MPGWVTRPAALGRAAVRRTLAVALAPVGSVVSVATRARLLALTFDDGPDEDVTPRVLDTLEATGSSATFFVLLTRVRRSPGLLREIVSRGHEIALHGLDHRRLTSFPAEDVRKRLEDARSELRAASGRDVRWFRPPYGAQTPATALAIRRAGLTPVLWGPSLWDWRDADLGDRRRKALQGVGPGAIVLGHDGIAGPDDGDPNGAPPSLDRPAWLREMLATYADLGLRGRSLGEVAATGRPVRRARFIR